MHGRLTGAFVVLSLAASGCGPDFQTRLPNAVIVPSRMEILPPQVREQEIDTADERSNLAEAKDVVGDNVKAELDRQAQYRRATVFRPRDYGAMDPALRPIYNELWRWAGIASLEIAAQETGHRNFGLHSVGDWQFRGDLAPLRAAWQTDTALMVTVHDTHESTGRVILSGLAGVRSYWKQIGVACLVSLFDGRMIWCNVRADAWHDLRVPANARTAIYELLSGLDPAPQATSKN